MKILVISDTHGSYGELEGLLHRYASTVQTVVHLGDCSRDLMRFESQYPNLTMAAVAGNTDFSVSDDRERLLNLGENTKRRFLLTHGHKLGVKMGLDRLAYYAREKDADACLFGHTHVPAMCWRGSVFMFNPGSLAEPRGGSSAGYGIITLSSGGDISGELIKL
jgi:hypothetical protein